MSEQGMAYPAEVGTVAYQVGERVLLMGQPAPEEWGRLRQWGATHVLNIRRDPERAAQQAQAAHRAGLTYSHCPFPAYELEPHHLQEFHARVRAADGGKVVIHCRSGTRAALLWLLTRTEVDGWTPARAEAELRGAGYGEETMETLAVCLQDYEERVKGP